MRRNVKLIEILKNNYLRYEFILELNKILRNK